MKIDFVTQQLLKSLNALNIYQMNMCHIYILILCPLKKQKYA